MAKYNVGDEVYVVEEQKVIKAKISRICQDSHYKIDTNDKEVALFLRNAYNDRCLEVEMYSGLDDYEGSFCYMSTAFDDCSDDWDEVHERYIFSSYEEALDNTW